MKKQFFILACLLFALLFAGSAYAAEGDLLWAQTSNPSTISDQASNMAIDNTGVYIGGYDLSLANAQWRVEKRDLSNGNLIWSQTSNPSGSADYANEIAIDGTGIYVVGDNRALGNTNPQWHMEKRSLDDGSLLWSQTSNPTPRHDYASGVAVDSTGVYIVGWQSISATNSQWRIEKRDLATGALIWSQNTNPSATSDAAYGAAVDATGLYIVGYDSTPGNAQWHIEKRNLSNGNLIWSQTNNPSPNIDRASIIAVDSTGVYLGGNDLSLGLTNAQWRVEKRDLSNGNLIWSQTSNPSASQDILRGGIVAKSTGLFISGTDSSPGNYQWRIEKRNLSDGSLLWVQTNNPSGNNDEATGLAVDSTAIYISGYDETLGSSDRQWLIEKRELGPQCNPVKVCCSAAGFFEPATTSCDSWVNGERCGGSDCGDNVEEHSFTQYCSSTAENCTGSIVDNGWVIKDDCGMDEKCNESGPSPLCAIDPVCFSASDPAEFQIVSFDLSDNFVSVESGSSVPVDVVVNIRNIGGDSGDAGIDLVVKDGKGNEMLPVPLTASLSDLAVGDIAKHVFEVDVPSSWDAGLYFFYASVGDGTPPLHDQQLKTLTLAISKPPPVPELPFFLVPLAAFSVLAVLFFAGKRQF